LVAADVALAINPADPRAMLYKGLAQMREFVRTDVSDPAQWKAARGLVVKANRAQPDNPYPLFHYYRSFADQGVAIPELAVKGLARAQQLVPQDGRFRIAYAQVLIREKRFKDALTLVKPVAFDPHDGSEYARNLVKRLEKAIATNGAFEESEELIEPSGD
jgi:predicted Zn-dependent protease